MFDVLRPSDAKAIAKRLHNELAALGFDLKHSQALELVAKAAFCCRDYNTLCAAARKHTALLEQPSESTERSPLGDVAEFLQALFTENHVMRNGRNPQAAFLAGWEDHQVEWLAASARNACQQLARKWISVDAARKTPLTLYNEIVGAEFRSADKAAHAVADLLYHDDVVIIVKSLSQLNDRGRARHARWLAKVIDDTHFDSIHPKADLVFVDFASFLEKSYRPLGPYVHVFAEPASLLARA